MKKVLHLRGVIRNMDYDPLVIISALDTRKFEKYDINSLDSAEIIEFSDGSTLTVSKWLSPKLSRSHPSARMYRTYHLPKPITIIPILKDEGGATQNNDRLMFTVLSRMNLMNVFIILGWYETAKPHAQGRPNRITDQRLNVDFVRERLLEVKRYKSTALHWNRKHFERDYEFVFRQAVESYERISCQLDLEMHPTKNHLRWLEKSLVDGKFNLDAFRESSLPRSASAAHRESMTIHELEYLADGNNATLELENYLGGIYYVTVDEVYWENGKMVIQESKNSKEGKLPSLTVIQDGLFKNILAHNIDELYLGNQQIEFITRMKLTGNIIGELKLPDNGTTAIDHFADINELRSEPRNLLHLLHRETMANPGLSIEIASNK